MPIMVHNSGAGLLQNKYLSSLRSRRGKWLTDAKLRVIAVLQVAERRAARMALPSFPGQNSNNSQFTVARTSANLI